MVEPMNRLSKMGTKAYHQELTSNLTGWKELTWPFVAFVLFLVGRVLSLVAFIGTFEILLPGLTEKPFTMYILIATFFFAPLGLQFFLAFQEFVFYSFSTYQAAFANLVLEMRKMSSKSDLTNEIMVLPKPGLSFHEAVLDLRDMMESMTQMFGPFLLQNLTLMLVYWLLHLYNLCLSGYYIFANFSLFSDDLLALQFLALAGSALIVR